MLGRLGGLVGHHPVVTLLLWLLVAVGGFGLATGTFGNESLFDRLTSGEPTVPGDSRTAQGLLDERTDTGPAVTALLEGVDPADPAVAELVGGAREDLLALDGVDAVVDPYVFGPQDPRGQAFVGTGGESLAVVVTPTDAASEADAEALVERLETLVADTTAEVPGARGEVGGVEQLVEAVTEQVEEDLRTGELVALPVSLAVMVFVFGGFLAAGIPIVGAVASIAGALASLLAFSYALDVDSSVVSVLTVLGLGLSIDYGLLIVSRYREEARTPVAELPAERQVPGRRHRHSEREQRVDALRRTMSTAGRTVMFSGITVALSLSGLLLFEADILRAVGAAGLSVVAVALLVALTLVPGLLAVGGARLLRPGLLRRVPGLRRLTRAFGDVPPPVGFFSRLAGWTQAHPWVVVGGVVALLAGLAVPALDIRLRSSGVELLPEGAEQRVLFETLDADFPALRAPDLTVVSTTTEEAALAELVAGLEDLPEVAEVRPPEVLDAGGSGSADAVAAVAVVLDVDDVASGEARGAVEAVRTVGVDGGETYVTGLPANLVDFTDALVDQAPLAIAVVVTATFVLLFLMTGSLLVPAKALVLNVLSLGASFGVLVLVFQDGFGDELLGFTATGGIEVFIPPLVLALGFGLAMDYEVFLLARIKELRDAGFANDAAVAAGLQRSGRIITSAALIICIVFAGFVTGELLIIKQTGVALAVAVAIDATLVRVLLVPATMTLLGEWNWWAPGPLRRLHERFGVSE
ncbi:MMPL family transporter [Aquipuribacter nitratireducens]|uniref:MMPL family transporter n=1 Tax=Aquipuribacter nitratireducens TaxID=650104 RepID=A0ABW0GPC0_9MICO